MNKTDPVPWLSGSPFLIGPKRPASCVARRSERPGNYPGESVFEGTLFGLLLKGIQRDTTGCWEYPPKNRTFASSPTTPSPGSWNRRSRRNSPPPARRRARKLPRPHPWLSRELGITKKGCSSLTHVGPPKGSSCCLSKIQSPTAC